MINKAIPQLPSLNLARSKQFYEEKLKFKLKHHYSELIILEKDNIGIHLWLCDNSEIPNNSSAYFHVTEIDDWYGYCERLGIVHPNAHLEDKPWGLKEFHAVDPDGNLLKFGQFSFQAR